MYGRTVQIFSYTYFMSISFSVSDLHYAIAFGKRAVVIGQFVKKEKI